MWRLFRSELRKIKWMLILLLMVMDAAASFTLAAQSVHTQQDFFEPNWLTLYFQAVLFHGLFFLPLFTGIFAAFLCFYEHKHNAWKVMLTLPFPRWKIYWAKLGTLFTMLAVLQLFFLVSYLGTGAFIHVQGSIPWGAVLEGVIGGWLAAFPLAALQLYLGTRFKSFGGALLFSVSMVIPNIVITGLNSIIGAWFPAAPPYYAMFPQGLNLSPRLELLPFVLIVACSFGVYLAAGCRSFAKRDWT